MPGKLTGVFVAGAWVLAWMIFWGWIIRTNAAKNPDSPFWQGFVHTVG